MGSIWKTRFLLWVGLLLVAGIAAAAEEPTSPDLTGSKYVYFGLGSYSPDRESRLGDENGKYAAAFGIGWRRSRHVAWEIELANDYYSVNTPASLVPPPGFLSGAAARADISKIGIAGNFRLIYPIGRFEPYVGAGAGLYFTEIDASTVFTNVKADDSGFGLQFLAGAEYVFGKGNALGIQYRKLSLSASFGPGLGDVDVGGGSWLVTFRWTF